VLTSSFPRPAKPFGTPYRVIHCHAYDACRNDPAKRFDHRDIPGCPRHAGTIRPYECNGAITTQQTTAMGRRIPACSEHAAPVAASACPTTLAAEGKAR
jgi:autotransporter strand-loop-strand O-heptosyltransferase